MKKEEKEIEKKTQDERLLEAFEMYYGVNREENEEKSKQIFKEIGEEGNELSLAMFKFISSDKYEDRKRII